MANKRRTITVVSELVSLVDEWAKAKGIPKEQAYDRFMQMSIVRSNALANYAKRVEKGVAGKSKAKKGKAKKAA